MFGKFAIRSYVFKSGSRPYRPTKVDRERGYGLCSYGISEINNKTSISLCLPPKGIDMLNSNKDSYIWDLDTSLLKNTVELFHDYTMLNETGSWSNICNESFLQRQLEEEIYLSPDTEEEGPVDDD